ncbi:MAG: ornithine cyclodeaminase [Acidobacteriota bacterium]
MAKNLRTHKDLNLVPFVSVDHMMKLITRVGIDKMMTGIAGYIEDDFSRWESFDKTPRVASHSPEGVIELMPTADEKLYAFKYVNGHPKNMKEGLQTVTAFGVLSEVYTGYPVLLSEMTILTALRTAATSVMAAKYLARENSKVMAMIGNGAQSEFQALAFKDMLGIDTLRLYDVDPEATSKCRYNLQGAGFEIISCDSAAEAAQGADIITTCTADKRNATILTDDMIVEGVHINGVGGDCPGKTEIAKEILLRSEIYVEYTPQTRIEGDIQQLPDDYPVNELWTLIRDEKRGRTNDQQITFFDSVGFAIEDFSALRYVRDLLGDPRLSDLCDDLDLIANTEDPRDLYGMVRRQGTISIAA